VSCTSDICTRCRSRTCRSTSASRSCWRKKALLDKIVRRRRGGFCYELNGAFAALLTALGFDVTLLAAKVYLPDGRLGPPFDHLALRVDLDEPWLADVGFGAHARRPLRIAPEPQSDAEGAFSVHETADGDLQVRNGERLVYLAEARPRELSEFKPTCWWQATSPESHFTGFLTCSLPKPGGGRVTLSGGPPASGGVAGGGGSKLYETVDGNRTETELSDEEVLATYRDRFGVELDTLPVLLHPR
jgi:N-hydroxyarylamine O-acetyltransferase